MQCIVAKCGEFENSYSLLYILLKSCLCCCSLATQQLFTYGLGRYSRHRAQFLPTRTDLGRWITFLCFFFSWEWKQEAKETRAVSSCALPSFFFLSIIKPQIKIFSSSAGMSSFPLFSLMLRKNFFLTFKPYSAFFFLPCFPFVRLKCSFAHLSS